MAIKKNLSPKHIITTKNGQEEKEKVILVGCVLGGTSRWRVSDELDELDQLSQTAGAEVLQRVIQSRERIDPATFIGKGKAQQISAMAGELGTSTIIFNDDLSPAQIKNLERLSKRKIVDRSGLILDIFALRARTREAKAQVELAQLVYILPRLTRMWEHLSRQIGGIGVRGPGETQLEVDRRLVRRRISHLKKELVAISKQRAQRRERREDIYKIALVGYTNSGKSTLLNALTGADVFVEDRLFATLDATIRAIPISRSIRSVGPVGAGGSVGSVGAGGTYEAVLIDTVGFIRRLPPQLVASFRSTLEEVTQADLLLYVVDISHPQLEEQMEVVERVLAELGAASTPTLIVFNKIDLLPGTGLLLRVMGKYPGAVAISALKGIYLHKLRAAIRSQIDGTVVKGQVEVSSGKSKLIAAIHQLSMSVDEKYGDGRLTIAYRARPREAQKIKHLILLNQSSR